MKNNIKQLLLVGVLIATLFLSNNNSFSASENTKSVIGTTISDTFEDDKLSTCVADALGKSVTDTVAQSDLDTITKVECDGVSNIDGIDLLTNLDTLTLKDGSIENIDNISSLSNLTVLNLSNNQISDISAVSELTNLKTLILSDNQISDISAVSELTKLVSIEMSNNQISDISALDGLNSLTSIVLGDNQISDISVLDGLPNLTWLELNNNEISDISPLENKITIFWLELDHNQISDITPLWLLNSTLLTLTLNDQMIDLGEIHDSRINSPQSTDILLQHGGAATSGTLEYDFSHGEAIDGDEIVLNDNMGTAIHFEDGAFSGTINFTRTNDKPIITQEGDITITEGDKLDILDKVNAMDTEDGDLTSNIIVTNPDNFKGDGKDPVGTYTITYTVTDSDGNSARANRIVSVTAKEVVDPIDGGGTDSGNTDDTNAGNTDDTSAGNSEDTNAGNTENVKAMTIAKTGLNSHIEAIIMAVFTIALALATKYKLNKIMY